MAFDAIRAAARRMNETMTQPEQEHSPLVRSGEARTTSRYGLAAVILALLCAIATFLILAGYTPVAPGNGVVQILFIADAMAILLLLGIVVWEGLQLRRQWRRQAAGAQLHMRIVGLFSIIAAAPALLMAVVGSVTVERSLNPGYLQDVRGVILNTVEAARLFRESECLTLLREVKLTANDLDRGVSIFHSDKKAFADYFASRAKFLGLTTAVMMNRAGDILLRGDEGGAPPPITPEAGDFDDARTNNASCLLLDEGRTFVALGDLAAFPDTFLYASRPVDPLSVQFPKEATALVGLFEGFEAARGNIQLAFAIMYGLLALIMLLSATWLGLAFANRLVAPIRRLIAATDQVATGNLYVQVPVQRSEGDLAHLGETFNKMTSELRLQQNRLMSASQVMDERRAFTEAVLAGVPAAIIGISQDGLVTVLNPSAQKLVENPEDAVTGKPVHELLPELSQFLADAFSGSARSVQGQLVIVRRGRERTLNVRVAGGGALEGTLVVTLDDITDLVSAQRTSAWADVARRIAHEIKNPLTPIQLSAERLKRKYSKVIVEDRDIFDQCTDTIVRQVEDIKRMVDEFSSFARMPKPRMVMDDLSQCVHQVVILMRTGHPEVEIEEFSPDEPVTARFDRRLISQALTNIVKNACEGLATSREAGGLAGPARIYVSLSVNAGDYAVIDVIDNGIGFPRENRRRLLEPYVTTRAEGTGLGLPIVAKILEDHGGGIDLLDGPDGQGARVALYFPREGVPEKIAAGQRATASPPPSPAAV